MRNNGRQYNRGAEIAQGMNYTPIANQGTSISSVLQGMKDGTAWKQQQEEVANKKQTQALMQRAGEDYASGNDAGFRENYGKANVAGLMSYDNQQKQNAFDNDYKNRQLVQQWRIHREGKSEHKGEFGYLLNDSNLPYEEKEKLRSDRLNTLAKSPDFVYNQAYQGATGKGDGQLPYVQPTAQDKAIGKAMGEAEVSLRKDEDMLNNAAVRRENLVDKMSKAYIGYGQNPAAQFFERKTPTAVLSSDQQQARQWLQSRGLSETLAMAEKLSGPKSDNDIAFLKAIVAGDITDFTYDQVLGAYDRITENAKQTATSNRRVLGSAPTDDDAWGGI